MGIEVTIGGIEDISLCKKAKYSREYVDLLLRARRISPAQADQMLRETED